MDLWLVENRVIVLNEISSRKRKESLAFLAELEAESGEEQDINS